jgi:hypothetical protein
VPAFMLAGAGMRRHLHAGHGAAESFVSCIRLFGGAVAPPDMLGLAPVRSAMPPRTMVAPSRRCRTVTPKKPYGFGQMDTMRLPQWAAASLKSEATSAPVAWAPELTLTCRGFSRAADSCR